jgi:hypothetical protein
VNLPNRFAQKKLRIAIAFTGQKQRSVTKNNSAKSDDNLTKK